MGIGNFLKRAIGAAPAPTLNEEKQQKSQRGLNPDPFGHERTSSGAAAAVQGFTAPSELAPAILQRDEIIDAKTRIAGYRFAARFVDRPEAPDARATFAVLSESRLQAFAARRMALIPLCIEDWSNYDWPSLIGSQTVFELTAPRTVDENWQSIAQKILDAGGKIALSQIDPERDAPLLGTLAHYVLLDFAAYPLANFEKLVTSLRAAHPDVELLVDNIASWPERRLVSSVGAAYCLGEFATQPDEEQQGEDISPNRLVLIEMLNLLRRDAELSDLVTVAKRNPEVAVQLVGMANSALFGFGSAATSIEQAIMRLGREPLYRWIAVAIFRAGGGSERDATLLELALARGRFLELIGQGRLGKAECDELFLVGLLSLMDTLLGVPMAKLLARIKLSTALADVLLRSEGPWGRFLLLAIAIEKGRVAQVTRLAAMLELATDAIETAHIDALNWAAEAAKG